ncbi:chemotaxis protein [Kiloniella spongiae]|uniref:Chemotaxis protein n=1 Tax=Kiloniella spongiae TaxID=1489064 RepID=A0A0H2MIV9_9PROT|nr:PAS domain-containing protein [Kiloniella spongiae]KLN62459.1 chemotaxis protein [Kiloniella spongiae]
MKNLPITNKERFFADDEIIVSKTDLKGRITYANQIFLSIAGYKEQDVLGQPHSLIRHPDMPRAVFKLLWDTLQKQQEIFAYVINRAKNGDHYWVIAHVTPSKNAQGKVIGYHSNRRVPDRTILDETIIPLYRELLSIEQKSDRKTGLKNSYDKLANILKDHGLAYDEFMADIMRKAG